MTTAGAAEVMEAKVRSTLVACSKCHSYRTHLPIGLGRGAYCPVCGSELKGE